MTTDYRLAKERWQHATVMSKVVVKSYLLKLPDGLMWKRHSDQIVKANGRGLEGTHNSWNPDLEEEDTEENKGIVVNTSPRPAASRDLGRPRGIPEKIRTEQ